MRGTLTCSVLGGSARRIIPADAGNTESSELVRVETRDHPRGCGEHASRVAEILTFTGSSPRMRGTPDAGLACRVAVRIIPADAGNTLLSPGRHVGDLDHPRGCGEHTLYLRIGEHGQWIIPADAGNTYSSLPTRAIRKDHPRGCGEHKALHKPVLHIRGSSPRMRGTRIRRHRFEFFPGIIPADAGNTSTGHV